MTVPVSDIQIMGSVKIKVGAVGNPSPHAPPPPRPKKKINNNTVNPLLSPPGAYFVQALLRGGGLI